MEGRPFFLRILAEENSESQVNYPLRQVGPERQLFISFKSSFHRWEDYRSRSDSLAGAALFYLEETGSS